MALPPGPRRPGAYGLLRWMIDPVGAFDSDFRAHGDLYTTKIPMYGTEVVVSHPELIKQIFTGDPSVFHGGEPNSMLGVVVGDRSVLLLDGREHHRQRKLLMPPFHGERLSVYAGVMREVTERVAAELPAGKAFPLLPSLQRITFDVILETVFGVREGAVFEALRTRLLALVEKVQSPLGMLWMLPAFQRDLGPLTGWAAIKRSLAAADEVLYGIIAAARAAGTGGPSPRQDVLSLLLAAVDEEGHGMTDKELRDELMTLLLAGYETTATTLAWAVEEIVRRPGVLGRIRAEVDAAPAGGATGAPLPYLDAAIKEVLRLHPISPLLVRRTAAPVTLRDYAIPTGTYLVVNAHNAQRHADFWEAPLEFRPERFLDKKPDAYAWVPFGGGARRCIGMAFALLEARVVLATLLSRVELGLPAGPAKVTLRGFLFAPHGGPRVTAAPRTGRAAAARAPEAGATANPSA